MYANTSKSDSSTTKHAIQIRIIEIMTLNSSVTGLKPRIYILQAINPSDILEALIRIRRELLLSYFENQKQNPLQLQKFSKTQCSNRDRSGHTSS